MRSRQTLWLIRHGPTHAKTMVGWTDLPADLSDTDRIARLQAALPADAPVVSSDLTRAISTADAISEQRPRLPHAPDLRELHFGSWENRSFSEVEAEDPDRIFAFWDTPGDITAPAGESWNMLTARCNTAIDRHLADGHKDLIVVVHFGVILTQLGRALGQAPVETFAQKIDNLSLTRIGFDGRWHVDQINHLP